MISDIFPVFDRLLFPPFEKVLVGAGNRHLPGVCDRRRSDRIKRGAGPGGGRSPSGRMSGRMDAGNENASELWRLILSVKRQNLSPELPNKVLHTHFFKRLMVTVRPFF